MRSFRSMTIALCALPLMIAFTQDASAKRKKGKKKVNPKVLISTSVGDIKVELYPEKAPKTVENFLGYVKAKHYNGTIFHRVIDNFMIQGGGYDPSFMKKPTKDPVNNEANNGLKNERGTIAMARTGDPHSATAQFFINVKDNGFLDFKSEDPRGWGYCVFGKVVDGMDVVDKIKTTKTGRKGPFPKDVPLDDVVIKFVREL